MERRGLCVCASRHPRDVSVVEMMTLWNPLVFVVFASSGDGGLEDVKGFDGFRESKS